MNLVELCLLFEMVMKTYGAEVCKIVEKPREPVQVYYPNKIKRRRFSKRLADRALLDEDKSNNTQGEDWISVLPDDILVGILSLLSIKEAGRSSILSHRWRYLWTFYTGMLEIEYKTSKSDEDGLSRKKRYVSKILKSHNRESVLDELIIRFSGKLMQSRRIDRWINFASEKCFLRRFELDFTPLSVNLKYKELVKLPRIDIIIPHHGGGGFFSSLTSLCFKYVNVTAEVIVHLLATCAFLKQLVVSKSYSLKILEVSGKGLKLESLEVYRCIHMKILTINNADNLVSLRYEGASLVVNNTPRLSELMIDGKICSSLNDMSCKHFSSLIQQLECLKIKLPSEVFLIPKFFRFPKYIAASVLFFGAHNINVYLSFGQAVGDPPLPPQRLPILYHLKHLELSLHGTCKRTLLYYTRLIEACPSLTKFTMQYLCLHYPEGPRIAGVESDTYDFKHGSLKVVELVGFRGEDSDYELAFLLLKIAAVSIEKLILSLSPLFSVNPSRTVRKLKSVKEQLEAKLPSTTVLVIQE